MPANSLEKGLANSPRPAFKNSELGPIPVDWEVKAIEEFYEIGSSKRVFQSQWRSDGIPFYRARDIVGFRRGEKAIGGLFIDKSLYEEFKRTYGVPSVGDLLVTAVGTLGDVFRVCDESPFYFKDGNIIWFKSSGKYDSRLLEILFDSGFLDAQIYDTAGGSTVGTYTISNAKKTLIPCPPLPEQRRIAAALSDADAWIESLDKLIEKKKLVKQGAMQSLLSGKTRLPGFSGKWGEKLLGDCANIIRGASPRPIEAYLTTDAEAVNWIKIGDVDADAKYITSTQEKICREGICKSRLVEPGDFLLSNSMSFGRPYITKIPGCVHDGWLVIQDYQELFDTEFLYYLLGSESVLQQYKTLAAGSSVLNLNKEVVANVCVPIPILREQRAIAEVLSDMDAELASLSREKAKAEQIKQGMMQELLTGRVRLAEGE